MRIPDRIYLCNRWWYRKLFPGYRNLPGCFRNHLQSTGRCNYGDQVLYFCITDAFAVRTWCNCCYHSNRSNFLQHAVLCMWNRFILYSGTGYDLPTLTRIRKQGKKEGLIDSLKHATHFSVESIAMILIGFTCTGTFQLWLNCTQNFAKRM